MKHRFFYAMAWEHGFWFRVYGYGLHIKLAKYHRPMFSERMGYRSALYLFGLRFELLKP